MKRLAMLRNEAGMALAGAKVREEKGDHLLEVLGVIIIAVVILVIFRNKLVPAFSNATDSANTTINKLFDTNTGSVEVSKPGT